MPLALVLIGLVLIVTAIRGTHAQLWNLIYGDITGKGAGGGGGPGFLVWLAAILAVGALGYIPVLRYPSRLLLGLIVLAIFISNQGVFANFQKAFTSAPVAAQQPAADPTLAQLPAGIPVQVSGGGGSSGGAGGLLGQVGGIVGGFAKLFGG